MPDPTGSRYSRRVRGMNDGVLYDPSVLELVEGRRRSAFKVSKSSAEQPDNANNDSAEVTMDESSQDGITDASQETEKTEDKENLTADDENENEEQSVDRVKRSLEFQSSESLSKGLVSLRIEFSFLL